MKDRASIKGQGASIFFGDSSEEPNPSKTAPPKPVEDLTSVRPDVTTSGSASGRASARTPEEAGDEAQAFFEALVLPDALKRNLRAVLRGERRIHTTIRLSHEEMAALRDLFYELETKQGLRLARNEVMRLALHLLLEDYALRKEKSLLLQVLKEEQQQY